MGWSARELGELAGTSRRTVRHYQEIGLLHEPARRSNGYLQYDVTHLVRLLRIRRLSELGLSLSAINALAEDDEHPAEALRSLRDELDATIARLQGQRADLDDVMARSAPLDLPVELADAGTSVSEADRALTVVLARVLRPDAVPAWNQLLSLYGRAPAVRAFDHLPESASEQERSDVAAALADHMQRLVVQVPEALAAVTGDLARRASSRRSVDAVLDQLYSAAQLDVLRRASVGLTPSDG